MLLLRLAAPEWVACKTKSLRSTQPAACGVPAGGTARHVHSPHCTRPASEEPSPLCRWPAGSRAALVRPEHPGRLLPPLLLRAGRAQRCGRVQERALCSRLSGLLGLKRSTFVHDMCCSTLCCHCVAGTIRALVLLIAGRCWPAAYRHCRGRGCTDWCRGRGGGRGGPEGWGAGGWPAIVHTAPREPEGLLTRAAVLERRCTVPDCLCEATGGQHPRVAAGAAAPGDSTLHA